MLGLSKTSSGSYSTAIYEFVVAYVVLMAVTAFFYLRRGSSVARPPSSPLGRNPPAAIPIEEHVP